MTKFRKQIPKKLQQEKTRKQNVQCGPFHHERHQDQVNHSFSSDIITLEASLQEEYREILKQEELLWFQNSHEDWIKSGDYNTRFFHIQAVVRRHKNTINKLKLDDETWCPGAKTLRGRPNPISKTFFAFPMTSRWPLLTSATFLRLAMKLGKPSLA